MSRRDVTMVLHGWLMLLGALLAVTTGTVYAQNVIFDDFNSEELSSGKWTAQQVGNGGLELVRQIVDGKLQLAHRVVGARTSNTGQNTSVNRLMMRKGGVTAVKFKVVVQEVDVRGCPEGDHSRVFVGFTGTLFTDDEDGDVGTFFFVERRSDSTDEEDILRIKAGLFRCSGNNCSSFEDLGEIDLGTLALGQSVTLRMIWEEASERVRFQRDSEPKQTIRYNLTVDTRRDFRVFQIRGDAANCESGPQPFAQMKANLDNIFINP